MKPVSQLLAKRANTLWHVRPDDTVFAALELLARHEVGALVVMESKRASKRDSPQDNTQDGAQLVGVVSERDYTRKVALQGRSSKDTKVAEIMTGQVVTVAPETDVRACMALMSEGKFRHLPVVRKDAHGHTVLGMISIRDIMDDIIADHEHTIAQLETYIQS